MTLNMQVNRGGALQLVSQIVGANQGDIDSRPDNYNPNVTIHEDDEAVFNFTGMQVDLELSSAFAAGTPPQIRVGDEFEVILSLRNVGPARGDNVKVKAFIPAGLTYVSSVASIGMYDIATTDVWVLNATPDAQGNRIGFSINPNVTETLRFRFRASQTGQIRFPSQVRVCNYPDVDSSPNNNSDPLGVPVEDDEALTIVNVVTNVDPNAADLQLGLTSVKTPIAVGDSVVFTLGITDLGPAAATGVTVNLNLPAAFALTAQAPAGTTYANGVWTVGALALNAYKSITFRGTSSCFSTAVKVFAQVQAADQADPNSPHGNDTNQVADENDEALLTYNPITCTTPQADLQLTSTAIKTPLLNGDSIVYQLVLVNNGAANATGVTVKNVLPTALASLTVTPSVGTFASSIWNVGSLNANNTVTLTFRGIATLTASTVNFAQVQTASPTDPNSTPGNNTTNIPSENDETALTFNATSTPNADLGLAMTSNTTAVANGTAVTFTLTLTNRGPSNTSGVTVEDLIPSGLTLNSATASVGTYSAGLWTIGTFNNGQTATLTLNTTVNNIVTTIKNFAQVKASVVRDPNSTPNNNTTGTPVEDDEAAVTLASASASQVDLSLTLSSSYVNALPIYQDVVVRCSVKNSGLATATGVTVKYPLPAGLVISSGTPTVASRGTYDPYNGTWTIGNIAPNETVTLNVGYFTLQTTASIFAQVQTADQADPNSTPGNNTTTNPREDDEFLLQIPSTVRVKQVDLALAHTANRTIATDGQTVTYSISINNSGDTTASGVTVKALIPSGLTYLSSNAQQGSYNPTTGIWTIGQLPVGTTRILTIIDSVVNITGTITAFAQVQTASPADLDSSPGNNTTTTPTEDDEAAVDLLKQGTGSTCDLALVMTSAPTYRIYNNQDFTLTLRNTGGVAATNVTVDFPFPQYFVYSGKTTSAGTSYEAYTHIWTVGTLAAGASATMTLSLFNLNNSGPIKAFAQVVTASPIDADSSPGNNTTTTPTEDDEAAVTVVPAAAGSYVIASNPQFVPIVVKNIYPNPNEGEVNIELNSLKRQDVTFDFFNAQGNLILSEKRNVPTGLHRQFFDLTNQPTGLYFLQINTNEMRGMPLKISKN